MADAILPGNFREFFRSEVEEAVVDHDEVVSRTVHFGKFQNKAPIHW
jgi:hypothetical protein